MSGTLMRSISGVRGIVGSDLTAEVVARYAAAFGRLMTTDDRRAIVLARDSRESGPEFAAAARAALIAAGVDVVDGGMIPTPTAQLAVEHHRAAGGIIITASHNPIEWNGLKFVGPSGTFLDDGEGSELLKIYAGDCAEKSPWDGLGRVEQREDAISRHIDRILALDIIQVDRIRERKFKVVLDCVNVAGSEASPLLLERLGCEVIPLHCTPTGLFPHPAEPVPEHLTELCDVVKKQSADVGFANDPDADRLAIVSETEAAIGEEYSLALAAKFVLSKRRGPIVANLSTSRMLDDIAGEYGVEVHRTPVGEVHVAQKIVEIGAPIGGEGNGGVIFQELNLGRDALVGMALILQTMAETGKTVSELKRTIPEYAIVKRKYEPTKMDKDAALGAIREAYDGEEMDLRDGIKLLRERSWLH
ncbi:MAG: phosphoglucosamine mutase, partial [Candidatus Latescibacteria bacterium]|nr:phosphoglucosamine mutase [Candidatus Latescibacterota bacterium]